MMLRILALISLFVAVSTANAHPGHSHGFSGAVETGIAHPWTGIDHLMAMVLVGVLATQCGPRRRWSLPVLFCGSMAVASLAGQLIGPVSRLDIGLAITLIALAACLVGRFNHATFPAIVTLCGGLHGFAHGADLGAGDGSAHYLVGVILGTAVIHLIGIGIGTAFNRTPSRSPRVDPLTSNTVA
ncbi:HupE/UreJ family protein [Stieleria sp. ICT_E10.1]|uniref:HupE/UreJ family protein n=1 Tax=Stieleria sedimenti TaxID=2976331 RepID=UPI00217F3AF6|nr:HupE/UreJ family protein [Stieleria sedimenti]MCS7469845.1 HupE/UreJ family protein [Stieleria sedimenti]